MNEMEGLFLKYRVERIDGKSDSRDLNTRHPDQPPIWDHPDYFVLKLNSGNKYEIDAIEAYAHSCQKDLPHLAADLLKKVIHYRKRFNL